MIYANNNLILIIVFYNQLLSMSTEVSFTEKQIKTQIDIGKKIVILFGGVYDLTHFILKHPGGKDVINLYVGKDAT
jgi:cytochrome b involved in lipid metabolism